MQQLRAIHNILRSSETRLEKLLLAALDQAHADAAENYPEWKKCLPPLSVRLSKILTQELTRSAQAMANMSRDQMKAYYLTEKKNLPSQSELRRSTSDWARAHVAQKVSEITSTTETRIATAVADGIENDDSPDEIARSIVDRGQDINSARARTIARTETSAAVGTAQQDEMEAAGAELGVDLQKAWTATEDATTRETHSDADGQTVGLDEAFEVGDAELDFPGDPNADAPEETINCRCVAIYGMG